MTAVRKEYNFSFIVCEDHFDMIRDVNTYRNGRPVLKENAVPHRNLDFVGEVWPCVCQRSTSSYNVTERKEFRSVECQTDLVEYHSFSCQTDAIELEASLGSRNNNTDTFSTTDNSSGTVYEPTLSEIEDAYEEEEEEEDETEDEFDDDTDDVSCFSAKHNSEICNFTMRMMEANLNHYTGIPKESSYLIDLIVSKSQVVKRNVLLILRKIRHNESLTILADAFGVSRQRAGNIFTTDIMKIATCLQPFIYWPEPTYIKRNLPLQFKHKFKEVQIIIDCFENSIGKPRKPVDQALSWSQYKYSNTVKYLIGCTPDGFIIFISKGFLGRVSDNEIVRRSGFLKLIKKGTVVMADRGFKDLESEISAAGGILVKPPSVTAGVIYTTEEANTCKSVAATRVHVERVIKKIRDFVFLKPQTALLRSNRTYLLEYAIVIASAICNVQGLLTKI